MKLPHYSPSTLNLFSASPAMFVLEKILGRRQPVGAPVHRGTAVEAGIAIGLEDPNEKLEVCVGEAHARYDKLMALNPDSRREEYRKGIEAMVTTGLELLRPYGKPSSAQGLITWHPPELLVPIIGYYDFHWQEHNLTVDLKTTAAMPSSIKVSHARQVAFYSGGGNAGAAVCYVTPKKGIVYTAEDLDAHRACLLSMAKKCEAFMALSDDPQHFVNITAPDLESFYWGGPAREIAYEIWGI